MKDVRFKNLYDAMTAHIDYCNMLEFASKCDIDFTNTNFDLLRVLFSGFGLTLMMEDYFIKKTDSSFESKLLPDFLKYLICIIGKDNGNGYTFGDLSYRDECTALIKIRHKIAHGDFIIENGEIIFEENHKKGKISVEKFIEFVSIFEQNKDDYLKAQPRIKQLYSIQNKLNLRQIKNEKDFDFVCDNLYKIEIKDYPIFPKIRTTSYCEKLKGFYQSICDSKEISITKLEKIIEMKKSNLEQSGIKIEYNITKLSELDNYEKIKKIYLENIDYKKFSLDNQVSCIVNFSHRLSKGKYQKFDLQKGISLNDHILKYFKNNPTSNFSTAIKKIPEINVTFLNHMDYTVLTSYLVGFNAIIEYGLENGLSKSSEYDLISVLQGAALDFSKLDLDQFYDPAMTIEKQFYFQTEMKCYRSKDIKKLKIVIKNAKKSLNEYMTYSKNKDKTTEKKLKHCIKEAGETKKLINKEKMQLIELYKNFDINNFTKNLNIIVHIRNAIAHGNIYVESCNNDISNAEIVIQDIWNGKIVYQTKLKLKEFINLFSSDNFTIIYNYVTSNIEDKSLIDDLFLEKITERMNFRQKQLIR